MRFIEIPALITEDIEDPSIVDITEPITVSISGTTMTINGQDTDENSTKLIVSGEATVTLTGDTTVDAFTLQNIRAPSLHKISVKTNNKGNFTYVPNNTVTASSVSTTTKTGSDFEILLITTNGGETYVDFDMADYTSPALYTSNALTGFDISELTSTYGATAKLYKPDGTLLTTVNSATTGGGVNFGYTESLPGDVEYKLEVTDDLGRKSTYNLPRKWINYAMGTGTTPGFQKFRLEGTDDDYTTTVMFPSLGSSSTAKVYRTSDHGYLGINFKIQGRNSTGDDWVDIANADEDDEVLAFGDFLYHRVWVKPTAKATTTVSSSNVVTLTLSNLTEENVTTSFDNFDPYDINESTNTYVFEETTKIGTVPFTVTLGTETYTNAVTATTEEVSTVPNTDMTAAGPNMKHTIVSSWATLNTTVQVSGDGKYIIYEDRTTAGKIQVMKGDPENGYTNYTTITYTQGIDSLVSAISYDGKYILFASWNNSSSVYEMHLNDESAGTYSKLSTTYSKLGNHRCYAPAFIPRSGNYDFVLTGSDNNATCYIRLYKHNTGTDTWTAKSLITDPTNKPTGDENRGYKAKSFTSDGKYLMFGNMGVYGGYEMYTIDWDANTAVFSGANYSNNGNVGASGAVSFDGKYVLIFHTDSNSRKIFKNNDAGDWSSATDVTTDFTFADTDNDQGHGFSFCGEHSEFFVSGMNAGAIRMYSWYAKNSVTLTFSNPTLTLTGQNVTISSAKLYRDDVLFHTYGTESNVVLRSDQTGTYQAVVNDVYYSNRVTPDFTTTRSVSAPQLEFDGYNRLNLSNITPTSTTLGLPDGTTRDLTTQSKVYIYEPGTYTANVQTSETFAYLSNVVTSQPSQNPTDVGPTFTFDEYNRLAISNLTQTSSTLEYGSNTYDTNTASNVYVTDAGEYKLEARDANTFVMSNVYVGAVSQHPSDVVPTLTFDGYNKLTIDNVDTVETATIKKDGAAFATTTSNTVYIRDTGTYTAEVKGSNVYAIELSKEVNAVSSSLKSFATPTETKFTGVSGFGEVCDISGNKGIIGNRDGNYVYFIEKTGTGWSYNQVTGDSSSRFGWKVGISGDYAAVASSSIGKVTIYKHNGTSWSEIHSVTNTTNYADGLAMDGTNIITGQRYQGKVRILSRVSDTNWTVHTLTLTTYTSSYWGHILDISGDYAITGIPDNDNSKGAVAIFYWSGSSWAQQGSFIKPSIETANDEFGTSVSISENYAVIGVPFNNSSTGCVYIFTRNGTSWGSEDKIVANDASTGDKFGYSVKLSGDYIIVGAREADIGSVSNAGAVYIFKRDGSSWSQTSKIVASDGVTNDYFGHSVSISGDNAIVGAYGGYFGYVYEKSLSGPNITYDGKNKLTVSGTNYEDTATVSDPNGSTYNIGTAKTMYVKDTGEYVFKISGTDKYVESNVYVSSVDLAGAPTKPIDFDGYNKLTLIDAGSNVSANVTYFSNTYELGSANVLYINGAGTYDLEMSGSNVFALSSNVVGTVSQHPTDVVPSLTFDNYNKLTLENFTTTESDTRTAKLTDPNDVEYSLGQTQNDIYIEDTGEYILEVTNSDQSAVVAKNIGTISTPTESATPSTVTVTVREGTDNTGTIITSTSGELSDTIGPTTTPEGTYLYWLPGYYEVLYDTSTTPNKVKDKLGSTYTDRITSWEWGTTKYEYTIWGPGYYHITLEWTQPIRYPRLTYDTYNKLSIENLTPTSTTLRFGSNTYDIGTASNVYIEHAGTYKFATGDANTFALVSNVVGAIATDKFDPLDPNSVYSILGTAFTPSTTSDTQSTTSLSNDGTRVLVDNETGYFIQVYEYSSGSWTQLGSDINYGTSSTSSRISGDGNRVCVGISSSNQVKVYEYSSGSWSQIGTTITGSNGFGTDTSLNYDGTRLMVGASGDYNTRGNQTVWQESGGNWTQLGSTLYCNHNSYPHSLCGGNVDINNDGTVVCAGGYKGHSQDKGCLHVWKYNGSSWTQSFFSEGGNDHHSNYCRLSGDGKVVMYSHDRWNEPRGRVNFYENTSADTWSQIGGYLEDKKLGDLSNDGKTVVVGKSDASIDSQVYRFDGSAWVQLGSNLEHTSTTLSISSDGSTVAIGNSTSGANKVSVYKGTTPLPSLTYNTSNKLSITNLTPTSTTLTDPNGSSFDIGTASNVYIRDSGTYSIASKDANTFLLASNTVTGTPTGTTYVYDSNTFTTPSQTYDTTKTITVKDIPTDVAGKIYKGSTAYPIHATTSSSNVIIKNTGTYVSVFTTATQAFLTNAIDVTTQPTTTSDDTTIEDEGFIPGSTAVPDETTTDAPSVTLDATDTTVTDPTLDLDFTTTLPRTLKRYNGVTNSSIGARFNRHETNKKRIEKSINTDTFSMELTANNASSPTTLTVTVANSKFVINDDETPTLGFIRGETYTFDQSDASNSGHPLVLATSADGATQYTTGWTTTPSSDYIPGVSGAQGTFIVPYDVPDTIYYKCTNHAGMGGEIHTTFGNTFSLGEFTVAANTHVSGEYTLATNYDGTTSNLYVNGSLITQTTPSPAISAGVKDFILGKEFDGYVKNFKFWNYAKHFILFTNPNFTGEGVLNSFSGVTLEYVNTTGVYANYIWKTSSGNIVTDSGVKFNVVERRWYDVRTGDETDANNKPYHFEIRQGNASSVDASGGTASNPSGECINGNLVIFRGINDDNDWLNSIYMSGIV
jgi:hypothetical protein